ncbi:hypothetical protein Dsin_024778 [Dipteronia sinensis]|uniref:Uncharacterized protein n=1 Tax=Dipteronia sinensis TaxID=43782 RepID=A0AAD9ZW35_9ROSI|nr:hypothetical protein Dsin_024778 [Dipteronia sinensis]
MMMMTKGVLAVVLLMMVSSVSALGNGFSSCTCSYVDGRVVTGTIVTSPDSNGSICTCPVSQPPSQTSAPVARNLPQPQPQHPAFQLPPIPFMDPRAQSCLQEFLDSNACMAQAHPIPPLSNKHRYPLPTEFLSKSLLPPPPELSSFTVKAEEVTTRVENLVEELRAMMHYYYNNYDH